MVKNIYCAPVTLNSRGLMNKMHHDLHYIRNAVTAEGLRLNAK